MITEASNSLKLLGQIQCPVEAERNKTIACFKIAKDTAENIFTWKTAEDLIFIKVNVNRIQSETRDKSTKHHQNMSRI